jgi:hypothetical protein
MEPVVNDELRSALRKGESLIEKKQRKPFFETLGSLAALETRCQRLIKQTSKLTAWEERGSERASVVGRTVRLSRCAIYACITAFLVSCFVSNRRDYSELLRHPDLYLYYPAMKARMVASGALAVVPLPFLYVDATAAIWPYARGGVFDRRPYYSAQELHRTRENLVVAAEGEFEKAQPKIQEILDILPADSLGPRTMRLRQELTILSRRLIMPLFPEDKDT